MTPKRATLPLSIILGFVILSGIGAFYLGDRMLQERSTKISDEKAKLEAVETELKIYKDSKEKVAKYGFINDLASKVLPENKLQSEVVAELTKFASENGISIQSLTFTGGSADNNNPNISQTDTVEGISGVRALNASVQFATDPPVSFDAFLNFLRDIENNQRKMQVTNLTLTPSAEDAQFVASATISISIFIKDNTSPASNSSEAGNTSGTNNED